MLLVALPINSRFLRPVINAMFLVKSVSTNKIIVLNAQLVSSYSIMSACHNALSSFMLIPSQNHVYNVHHRVYSAQVQSAYIVKVHMYLHQLEPVKLLAQGSHIISQIFVLIATIIVQLAIPQVA